MTLLRYAMIAIGLIFIVGIWALSAVWPSGWTWGMGPSHYFAMILGVYATLGIFLIRAARDPLGNTGLIWFTVWSSVVHAVVMAASAVQDPAESGHLIGDVPILLILAAALAIVTRRAEAESVVAQPGARRAA